MFRAGRDDRQVRGRGQVCRGLEAGQPMHRFPFRVDRPDGAGIAEFAHQPDRHAAEIAALLRRPDDGDGSRAQQRREIHETCLPLSRDHRLSIGNY